MYYKDLNEFKSANGYDIDGTWYPRVTAIVGIKSKPALYRFYADQKSFAAAEAMRDSMQLLIPSTQKDQREQLLSEAKVRLGEVAYAAARAAGRAMSVEQAFNFAIG